LGQAQDYTAIAVIEAVLPSPDPETQAAPPKCEYHIRYLERIELGTLYPRIVERVRGLLHTPPLNPQIPLVVDKTGVGAAVIDMFTDAHLKPTAITITGGDEVIRDPDNLCNIRVPKRELVGTLVALFQTDRLKIAEELEHAQTLVNELLNFRVKVDLRTSHDSYEAWRESMHDDLVLAVALACWYAENKPPMVYAPVTIRIVRSPSLSTPLDWYTERRWPR
jgi:hypothetical protein